MLTWEEVPIQGANSITEKLTVSSCPGFNCAQQTDLTACADVALREGAAQGDDARRTALFPDPCVAHRMRDWPARGEW